MKRAAHAFAVAALTATALTVALAGAAVTPASLLITHVVKGCHTWALNGAAPQVRQTLAVPVGGTVRITNNDLMPHQLVQLSGPAATMRLVGAGMPMMGKLRPPYAKGTMPHMSSALAVSFTKPGVYTFLTKTGDDYAEVHTVGDDNVLRMTVTVK